MKIYLGGEGVDQVPGTSIIVNSPFFTVDPATLVREQLSTPFPVISVEVQVAPNAPFGDYTIRLQSNSGEIAFVPGAITIDPAVATPIRIRLTIAFLHQSALRGSDRARS